LGRTFHRVFDLGLVTGELVCSGYFLGESGWYLSCGSIPVLVVDGEYSVIDCAVALWIYQVGSCEGELERGATLSNSGTFRTVYGHFSLWAVIICIFATVLLGLFVRNLSASYFYYRKRKRTL